MELNGTKVLETERLLLRPFVMGDEHNMFKNYCNDDRVCEYVTWRPHGNVENTKAYLQTFVGDYKSNEKYHWAIVLKETNEVIGSIEGIKPNETRKKVSLGYVLGYDFWGNEYMPEAVKTVINYLFKEGFVRIDAWHHIDNPKSGRVMQKAGMTYEGTLKCFDVDSNGVPHDMCMYAIVKK